ncbi:unnamed protein product [Withania somnifera]
MSIFQILSKYRINIPSLFFNIMFLVIISCLTFHFYSSNSNLENTFTKPQKKSVLIKGKDIGCKGIEKFNSREEKCTYVKSHEGCKPNGYIFYLQLFYCNFSSQILGYVLLALWLILLFYLLGDTASSYFVSSLEGLSKSLKLSPIVAGVTLLSLGNGAPDLFSSIVSFMNDGTNEIGLSSIIGGAFFVSSVVAGITSISISQHGRKINKSSFVGNVMFLILCAVCLLIVIVIGRINLWGALGFFLLYVVYVCFILVSEMYVRGEKLLDSAETMVDDDSLDLPMVCDMKKGQELELRVPLLVNKGGVQSEKQREIVCVLKKVGYVLELPLDLPRKLTIPNVSQDKWSKSFGVVSIMLAPLLLVLIWDFFGPKSSIWAYGISGVFGLGCGLVVFFTSDGLHPPKKFNFLWLGLGFLMSITWTYILAEELISLLVSMGLILGISPSILGLTVLAWGNSLGDLVSNVTLAKTGGPGGAQVALCGCYAGPIFNTLVGLGLSLIFTTWKAFPSSYIVPTDSTVYETIGFLLLGLLWALVILPKRDMKLDKFFGVGLLAIYSCFLFLKLARALSFIEFQISP